MHSQQPPGVVQNWSALQCSKKSTEQCGYDHAPVTRGRMRAQFPLPHGPRPKQQQVLFPSNFGTLVLLSQGVGWSGVGHKVMVLICLPLGGAPIGLSPLYFSTLCGSRGVAGG